MKFFKKFFAVLISAVMALALFVFAACDGETQPKPNHDLTPEDEDEDDVVEPTAAAAFLAKLKSQAVDSFEMDVNYEIARNFFYSGDNFPDDYYDQTLVVKARQDSEEYLNTTVNIYGNLSTGDIDYVCSEEASYHYEDGEAHEYDYKTYEFVRDWNVFSYERMWNPEGIYQDEESFDGLELEYLGDVLSSLGLGSDEAETEYDYSAIIRSVQHNYIIAALAKQARALSITEGKATVNVNKLVYNTVKDFKTVVDGLKTTTTVGDILANETVKGYLSVFTELVEPEDVQQGLKLAIQYFSMLEDIGGSDDGYEAYSETFEDNIIIEDNVIELEGPFGFEQIFAMLQTIVCSEEFDALSKIEPDEGSTTYDYLVKLISSEELGNIVIQILLNMTGDTQSRATGTVTSAFTLDKVTIGQILELADNEIPAEYFLLGMKAMYAELAKSVTATSLTVTVMDETYHGLPRETVTEFTGFVIEFTIDQDYNVSSQTISFDVEISGTAIDCERWVYEDLCYAEFTVEGTASFNATITYPSEEVELIDISRAVINEYDYVINGKKSDVISVFAVREDKVYSTDIIVEIVVEDTDVIGVYICDADGNRIDDKFVDFNSDHYCYLTFVCEDDNSEMNIQCNFAMNGSFIHSDDTGVYLLSVGVCISCDVEFYTTNFEADKVITSSITVEELLTSLSQEAV